MAAPPPTDTEPVAAATVGAAAAAARARVVDVHDEHGEFVWLTLQRLGARAPDLEDLFQEVFVVVQRRWGEFDGRSKVTTWLFGICVRVVAGHRRRAYVRRERATDALPEPESDRGGAEAPDAMLAARQAEARLRAALDAMDLERRAVFVMAVLEGVPHAAIAEQLGVAVGTVHSRLHAARREIEAAVTDGGAAGRRRP